MNERDAARARSEAVHHRGGHPSWDERRAARVNRALQNYVNAVYYPAVSRVAGRRRNHRDASRKS